MTSDTDPMIVVDTAVSIAFAASRAKSISVAGVGLGDAPPEPLVQDVAGPLPVEHGGAFGRVGRDPQVAQGGDTWPPSAAATAVGPRRLVRLGQRAHERQGQRAGQQDVVAERAGAGHARSPSGRPSRPSNDPSAPARSSSSTAASSRGTRSRRGTPLPSNSTSR